MDLDGWLEIDECAARMGLSVSEIVDLINARILRAVDCGCDLIMVQPAILG